MYGMVLMVAVTGSGDTASFGKRGGGCTGYTAPAAACGCSGGGGGGFLGGRGSGCGGGGGGLLGGLCGKHKGGGCYGSGYGSGLGCTGYAAPAPVVMAPPAPVVAAAPCCAPAPTCCNAAPAKRGLFSGLCKKKQSNACCATPVSYASPCGGAQYGAAPCATPGGPIVMPAPGPGGTPVPMPAPVPKKM